MIRVPRIALFRPAESSREVIQSLFQRQYDYLIRAVQSVPEILSIIQSEQQGFDAIILPTLLSDNSNALAHCAQIRSDHQLRYVPLLALVFAPDKAAARTMYAGGADVVHMAPFDADLLFLQICALGRQTLNFQTELSRLSDGLALSSPLTAALNFADECLILLTPGLEFLFANAATLRNLVIPTGAAPEKYVPLFKQFSKMLQSTYGPQGKDPRPGIGRHVNVAVSRFDGSTFNAEVKSDVIVSRRGETLGYAVAFSDVAVLRELARTVGHTDHARGTSLLLAAACMRLLNSPSLGSPEDPLKLVEQVLANETSASNIDEALTGVLEVLDLVINPEVSVRIDLRGHVPVRMKPSDLFQLLGLAIVRAARVAGEAGNVQVKSELSAGLTASERTVHITVTSRCAEAVLSRLDADLLDVIRGMLVFAPTSAQNKHTGVGGALMEVASRSGVKVQESRVNERETTLVLELPVA